MKRICFEKFCGKNIFFKGYDFFLIKACYIVILFTKYMIKGFRLNLLDELSIFLAKLLDLIGTDVPAWLLLLSTVSEALIKDISTE